MLRSVPRLAPETAAVGTPSPGSPGRLPTSVFLSRVGYLEQANELARDSSKIAFDPSTILSHLADPLFRRSVLNETKFSQPKRISKSKNSSIK